MSHPNQPSPHAIPYRAYLLIWAILLALTVVTVSISYVDMRHVTVLAALLVATVKASLVLMYFMHVRYERPFLLYMFLAVGITYAVFISLTFADYWTR